MARYLNPQKISLLVLTSLYCEAEGPSEATIPILSFLTSQLVSSPTDAAGAPRQAADCILSLHHFEEVLASHRAAADDASGPTLYDAFLDRLWAIDSLDALHSYFDGLSDLLLAAPPPQRSDPEQPQQQQPPPERRIRLSRTSPLGVFVRRAQLEFARLQFHDAAKLWLAFVNYKLPTAAWLRDRARAAGAEDEEPEFDANLGELGLGRADGLFGVAYGRLEELGGEEGLASMDEIERLLAFQIDRLQKYGNRVPDDMRDRLNKMLGPTSAVPSLAHFVKFFDAWRAGDYTSSFDNLHRYFDYTMQTRDKTYYQYALLHMAILQADFGCFSEAIAAMNETIATARENQDMSCLNFSLSVTNLSDVVCDILRVCYGNGSFAAAFSQIDDLAADLKAEDADVYQRIYLLTLKASLFAKTGIPEKGFSIAMRAASAAHRARLWPALWEALGVVQGILVELGEYRAAAKLGDAVIPQVGHFHLSPSVTHSTFISISLLLLSR
ncbi:hypothetical protein GTA08_BOTSDO02237 [Neofusicoccum parvum]|uniref:Uncharacterized protein n=1 Tax=Neofusicoccum parvum TaxID=310453 RepID=A0ACB5SGG3_9PEZI|nr:hypothetical protein GTA08_BOTSDO02237 [Neofusicoccum parvum]